MAVIFPVDPIDQQEFVVNNRTYVYNATKGYWRLAIIATPAADDWVRPADWLTLPTVGDTEQKFVGLMAITNDDSNFAALLARGAYTVDWGDGTIEDIADNVQAEHLYDYSAISNATLSSRGYKQVIITVTPQGAGNLTLININRKHSQTGLQAYETGWLDIEVGSPNFGTGASIGIGGAETVRRRWLERVRVANVAG
jgi:hypothetical protein